MTEPQTGSRSRNERLEEVIAHFGDVLAEVAGLHRHGNDTPETEAQEAIYNLYTDHCLPGLAGAAAKWENCGAIGSLVWGRKIIAPGNTDGLGSDAEIALKLGRVYLEAGDGPARDLLILAGIFVARAQEKEERRERARIYEALARLTPEARTALLAQAEAKPGG